MNTNFALIPSFVIVAGSFVVGLAWFNQAEVLQNKAKDVSLNTKTAKDTRKDSLIKLSTKMPSNWQSHLFLNADTVFKHSDQNCIFPKEYTHLKGITTFRGNAFRSKTQAGGKLSFAPKSFKVDWQYKTTAIEARWGGGAGWTGQPLVVEWPDSLRQMMNIKTLFKKDSNFTEVIQVSLDGRIYFFDIKTGKQSRSPINIGNSIKGTPAVHPGGWPLLFVGQGIKQGRRFGFRVFSLLDQSELMFIDGNDDFALRGWSAFDGSPLINRKNHQMILGGENGLAYKVLLNPYWDSAKKNVDLKPIIYKLQYTPAKHIYRGIESSVVVYKNLAYFTDNGGHIFCVDLSTMEIKWAVWGGDDTDATLVADIENDTVFLYTGCEVDKQGKTGYCRLKKINGFTGTVVWEKKYKCYSVLGDHPVNGGMLSTPLLGKLKAKNSIFFSISRYRGIDAGLLLALDKKTGQEIWKKRIPYYAWSSPVAIYDTTGKLTVLLGDSEGYVSLYEGESGNEIYRKKIAHLIEATPVVYKDKVIVPTRPYHFYCLVLKP